MGYSVRCAPGVASSIELVRRCTSNSVTHWCSVICCQSAVLPLLPFTLSPTLCALLLVASPNMTREVSCRCDRCLLKYPDGRLISKRSCRRHHEEQRHSQAVPNTAKYLCRLCPQYPNGHSLSKSAYYRHKQTINRQMIIPAGQLYPFALKSILLTSLTLVLVRCFQLTTYR